jgi:hypothetical protein
VHTGLQRQNPFSSDFVFRIRTPRTSKSLHHYYSRLLAAGDNRKLPAEILNTKEQLGR